MKQYVALTGRKYPIRYFRGLPGDVQLVREIELEVRRRTQPSQYQKLSYSDSIARTRPSSWTRAFNDRFPDVPRGDLRSFAHHMGFPYDTLKKVFDKGLAAWSSGGSRPGANAHQWAWARVYKFVLIDLGYFPLQNRDPDNHLRR